MDSRMTIAPAVSPARFRSLEGRPLGMSSSVMLPESARLRLLELGSSFVTALAEQRQPMTGLGGNQQAEACAGGDVVRDGGRAWSGSSVPRRSLQGRATNRREDGGEG